MATRKLLFMGTLDKDGGYMGAQVAMPIPDHIETYVDGVNFLRVKLSDPDFVKYIIERDFIEDHISNPRLYEVKWENYQLEFVFYNDKEDEYIHPKSVEFISLYE